MKSAILYIIKFNSMKDKFMKNVLFLFLSMFTLNGFTQENSIIQASPTVAELGKYGKIPVSYYTGQPNINIPLYTIKCGALELPLSLSYMASGIKVDQIASWVGLGWSLNAGGIIQCNIIGGSDLATQIPQNIFTVDPSNGQIVSPSPMPIYQDFRGELEPDIYSFNFCGYHGQFIIDKDLNVQLLNSDKKLIKINYHRVNSLLTTFQIIDNAGIIYNFDQVEIYNEIKKRCYYFSMAYNPVNGCDGTNLIEDVCQSEQFPQSPNGITGFFLTQMISPNGIDTIKFEYASEVQQTTSRLSGSLSCWQGDLVAGTFVSMLPDQWYGDQEMKWNACGQYPGENDLDMYSRSFSTRTGGNFTKTLKKITTSNGINVDFSCQTVREDIENSIANDNKRLDWIQISTNDWIKKWIFNYTYFESSISKPAPFTYLNKRLRLNSIQECSPLSTIPSIPPYYFHYYGDDISENKMPYRTCYTGIDYLGYCNSSVSVDDASNVRKIFPNLNNYCIPQASSGDIDVNNPQNLPLWVYVPNYNENIHTINFDLGSDRTANINFAKAYTLKEIDFPTGGGTLFDYELHDFGSSAYGVANACHSQGPNPCGGLRIKKITDVPNFGPNVERIFTYDLNGIIMEYPSFAYNTRNQVSCSQGGVTYPAINIIKLQSQPVNDLYSLTGEYIGYKSVTESITGHGKTVYNYFSAEDLPNTYDTYLVGIFWDQVTFTTHLTEAFFPFFHGVCYRDYGRGLIKDVEIYNESGDPVKKESYTYDFIDGPMVFGNQLLRNGTNPRMNIYHYTTGYSQLRMKTTQEFNLNTPTISTICSYKYNLSNLVSEETTAQSNGNNLTFKYKYPIDYVFSTGNNPGPAVKAIELMKQKDMWSTIIEKNKKINDNIVDGEVTEYSIVNANQIYPYKKYKFSSPNPIAKTELSHPATDLSSLVIDNCDSTTVYDNWDLYGNLIQMHKVDGIYTSYVWGYKNTLVIAKTDNAKLRSFQASPSFGVLYNSPVLGTIFNSSTINNVTPNSSGTISLSYLADSRGSTYSPSVKITLLNNVTNVSQTATLTSNTISASFNMTGSNYTLSYSDLAPTVSFRGNFFFSQTIANTNDQIECDYTGFENHEAPGWATAGTWSIVDNVLNLKTGKSSAKVTGTGPLKTFNVGLAAKNHRGYKASVWMKGGTDAYLKLEVVGQSTYSRIMNNPNNPGVFNLVEVELPYSMYYSAITSGMQIKVTTGSSGTAYFDDLRFYPSDAQMTSYTYKPFIGISSVSDENNKPSYYEYDVFNRLSNIKDFQGNVLKKYEYHYYSQPPIVYTPALIASPTQLNYDASSSLQNVSVNCNATWSVSSVLGTFITAVKVDETTLQISCTSNSSVTRTGWVKITDGTNIITINVTQNDPLF